MPRHRFVRSGAPAGPPVPAVAPDFAAPAHQGSLRAPNKMARPVRGALGAPRRSPCLLLWLLLLLQLEPASATATARGRPAPPPALALGTLWTAAGAGWRRCQGTCPPGRGVWQVPPFTPSLAPRGALSLANRTARVLLRKGLHIELRVCQL